MSPMSCQARVLGAEYPLEGPLNGETFHTTTFCGKFAQKRIKISDDNHASCNDCFRRYTSQKEWYGWMDCEYPPEAKVVGSHAFYRAQGKVHVAKLPAQMCPLGGCATCWRTSFKRTSCQTCETELCRACASVALTGDKGDFCKRCVPKAAPKAAQEQQGLSDEFAKLSLASAGGAAAATSGEPKVKAPPKPKVTLDYPIRTDIAKLSVDELRALHTNLVTWMKEYQNKFPRLLVPYYSYRIRLEALLLQKK